MVVGDNPDELIKKYDLDTKVAPYVKLKRSDAEKARKMHLKFIEDILTSNKIILTDRQRELIWTAVGLLLIKVSVGREPSCKK